MTATNFSAVLQVVLKIVNYFDLKKSSQIRLFALFKTEFFCDNCEIVKV